MSFINEIRDSFKKTFNNPNNERQNKCGKIFLNSLASTGIIAAGVLGGWKIAAIGLAGASSYKWLRGKTGSDAAIDLREIVNNLPKKLATPPPQKTPPVALREEAKPLIDEDVKEAKRLALNKETKENAWGKIKEKNKSWFFRTYKWIRLNFFFSYYNKHENKMNIHDLASKAGKSSGWKAKLSMFFFCITLLPLLVFGVQGLKARFD